MNEVSIAIGYINGSERYYGDKDHLLNQMQSGRETKKNSEYFFFTLLEDNENCLLKMFHNILTLLIKMLFYKKKIR